MTDDSKPSLSIWDLPESCSSYVSVLHGHTAPVHCVVEHNQLLLSGSEDGTIRVWDCMRLQCVHTVPGAHKGGVVRLAAFGGYVVSAGAGRVVKVWDPATWKPLAICDAGGHTTQMLVWDKDLLFTGRRDGQVLAWRMSRWTPEPMADARPHAKEVTGVVRLRDFLITGSLDSSIKIWAVPSSAAYDDGDDAAAAATRKHTITSPTSSTSTTPKVQLLTALRPFAPISTLTVLEDVGGVQILISTDRRGKTKRWDPITWSLQETLASRVRYPTSSATYDGLLYNGNSDGTFSVVSIRPFHIEVASVAHGKGQVSDCFVTEGTLVTASDDFTVRVHDNTSFALRIICRDDMVVLRRMLVIRRTVNYARSVALLEALIEYAWLAKWRNLSFIEQFVAHRVFPPPASLRLLHEMGGSQWLANCADLDVDGDGYISATDLVESLRIPLVVAEIQVAAAARQLGRPSVASPIGILDLMAGRSTMLRRWMAMNSAMWLWQNPCGLRQQLRFLDVSSFFPMVLKFLNYTDRSAVAVCSHACHAVSLLGISSIELSHQAVFDSMATWADQTTRMSWGVDNSALVQSVERPFVVPMTGHSVRALSFRSVPLTGDLLVAALKHTPSLTSLDILAPASFLPHIHIGIDALRFVGDSFPELLRLRLVYPGDDEIPMEMSQLACLTRFVVDSNAIRTPPQEVTELSAPAIRSFLTDLASDGLSAFMHCHIVLAGHNKPVLADMLVHPDAWVSGNGVGGTAMLDGCLADLFTDPHDPNPSVSSRPPVTASVWDIDDLPNHEDVFGTRLSAWRTLFVVCVDPIGTDKYGTLTQQLRTHVKAIEAYRDNAQVLVVLKDVDMVGTSRDTGHRASNVLDRVNAMLAMHPDPTDVLPRVDPYGAEGDDADDYGRPTRRHRRRRRTSEFSDPRSETGPPSDGETEGDTGSDGDGEETKTPSTVKITPPDAIRDFFVGYATDSYLHRRDYDRVRGWAFGEQTPKAKLVGVVGVNFVTGTTVSFLSDDGPPSPTRAALNHADGLEVDPSGDGEGEVEGDGGGYDGPAVDARGVPMPELGENVGVKYRATAPSQASPGAVDWTFGPAYDQAPSTYDFPPWWRGGQLPKDPTWWDTDTPVPSAGAGGSSTSTTTASTAMSHPPPPPPPPPPSKTMSSVWATRIHVSPHGVPALLHTVHRAVFDNLPALKGVVPTSYAHAAEVVRLIREYDIGPPPTVPETQMHPRAGDSTDRGPVGWRSSMLMKLQRPNSYVDREELVAQLTRMVPGSDMHKMRRAVVFLHQVGILHARAVVCPSGGLNLTVYLHPQFLLDTMNRAQRFVYRRAAAIPVRAEESVRKTGLEEMSAQDRTTTVVSEDTNGLIRACFENNDTEAYDLIVHELWLGLAGMTAVVTGFELDTQPTDASFRNLSPDDVRFLVRVRINDRNGSLMGDTVTARTFGQFRELHSTYFEVFNPRPKGLPQRVGTTVVAKHRYLTEAFCQQRVGHLNEYLDAVLACGETISKHLDFLRFLDVKAAVVDYCNAHGLAPRRAVTAGGPAGADQSTGISGPDDDTEAVIDMGQFAPGNVMTPAVEFYERTEDIRVLTLHDHSNTALVAAGFLPVAPNGEERFINGTQYWERELWKFKRLVPSLHPSDMALAKEANNGKEPPAQTPGLDEGVIPAVAFALREVLSVFTKIVPFRATRLDSDIRIEMSTKLPAQWEFILPEAPIFTSTFTNLLSYLWYEIVAVEEPLRRRESRAWMATAYKFVDKIVDVELARRRERNEALGHFMGVEKMTLGPFIGEVVDNITTQILPVCLAWLFYKLDMVRVDMVTVHYNALRNAFEARQLQRVSGLAGTRRWVHEVLRVTTHQLTPRMTWDLVLDSHGCRLTLVLEGLLCVLRHSHPLTAVARRPPAQSSISPVVTSSSHGPDWDRTPFPETFIADAVDLESYQYVLQRMAVVNAVSLVLARAVLMSPGAMDEGWEYKWTPREKVAIIKVMDTDTVRGLQVRMYAFLTQADTSFELLVACYKAFQAQLLIYDKMVLPDVYEALTAGLKEVLALAGPTYKACFASLCGDVRRRVTGVWRRTLIAEVDKNEYGAWNGMWDACAHLRGDQAFAAKHMPPYISSVFDDNLAVVGNVFARWVRRNEAVFAPYYRPFVQEVWTRNRALPVPQRLIGSE